VIKKFIKSSDFWAILLIILISLPAIRYLLLPGVFGAHDTQHHMIRFMEFDQALRQGIFPLRWAGDLVYNYGSPLFIFFYQFPYYLSEIFHLIGVSFGNSLLAILVLSILLSSIFFYLWAKKHFGKIAAFAGAIIYTYTPYHFSLIYVRFAYGEAISLVFIPLILIAIDKLEENKEKTFAVLFLSASLAMLFLTHNISTVIFLPIIFLYALSKKKVFLPFLVSMVWAVLISVYFTLPAFWETSTVHLGIVSRDYQGQFPTIFQLIRSKWDYWYSPNGMSFQIGYVNWFVGIVSLLILLFSLFKKIKINKIFLVFLVAFWFAIFMMNRISVPIYENLKFLQSIQFPWRYLSLVIVSSSVLAAFIISRSRPRMLLAFLLILFALLSNRNYLRPMDVFSRYDDSKYASDLKVRFGTVDTYGEALPKEVKKIPSNFPKTKVVVANGEITNLKTTLLSDEFTTNSKTKMQIIVNRFYYKGWKVSVDGRQDVIEPTKDGQNLIKFNVSGGIHKVKVYFEETLFWRLCDWVSLIAAAAWVVAFIAVLRMRFVKRNEK